MQDESVKHPELKLRSLKSGFENPWHQPSHDSSDRALFEKRSQRISVVVPARNEEEGIGAVLEACLTYADEVLVVDGHSTDRTREIAEEFGVRVVQDNGFE